MIEFSGYISGNAEQYFWKKSRVMVQKLFLISMLILLPFIVYISFKINSWGILVAYGVLLVLIQLCTYIPKSKKEAKSLIPKQIYTEDDYIVCVADKYEEYKKISDTEKVIDHGDFYELIFPFGNISGKFVCQKELLVSGSLEEFEALFEGKITRNVS